MRRFSLVLLSLLLSVNVDAAMDWSCPGRKPLISKNTNDVYNSGRGVAFQMLEDFTLTSFGVFLDVTDTQVALEIAQVPNYPAQEYLKYQKAVLYSDSKLFTCNEEYADFDLSAPLVLEKGKSYHINITHDFVAPQNFFYMEKLLSDGTYLGSNGSRWTVGSFDLVDGTSGYGTGNSVIADFLINDSIHLVSSEFTPQTPEPATLAILGLGGLIISRRKRA